MTTTTNPASSARAFALPNLLTYGRIAAVPVVVGCMYWQAILDYGLWLRWVALFVFIAAGITDVLDGYVARASTFLDPELKAALASIADDKPGVVVEDKKYSIALHYRLAPHLGHEVRDEVSAVCARFPSTAIEILPGKSVVEVKQPSFNKGTAVRELMRHVPFKGRRPIFIGDDVTDEAAFAVMPEFGGIGFSVGREMNGIAGTFETPGDVRRWIADIVAEKSEQQSEHALTQKEA